MDRRFIGILVAIIIIFAGVFALNQRSSNKNNGLTNDTGGSSSSAQPTNHIEGQGAKGVTLVEYGDYECPVCKEYYKTLNQVVQQYGNEIYFQFRNLPLTQIHRNAFSAARAAEAAGYQNKYWQMHDLLYENQDQTGQSGWVASSDALNQYFVSYAQQLGLNISQFKNDFASSKANDSINADLAAFGKTGEPMATPTFFLDGKYEELSQFIDSQTGLPSVQNFANVINAEIAKKNPKS